MKMVRKLISILMILIVLYSSLSSAYATFDVLEIKENKGLNFQIDNIEGSIYSVFQKLVDILNQNFKVDNDTPKLPNGKEYTDDNIREILYGFKEEYPEGRPWTEEDEYYSENLLSRGHACEAFALMCSDAVFEGLRISRRHCVFEDIRVGDLLYTNNGHHVVIVLEKKENSVIVMEGNYDGKIHWGREITSQDLEKNIFLVCSRYPEI